MVRTNYLNFTDLSAETMYAKWLRECYETAFTHTLNCIKNGCLNSRLQALVTACKMMQAEGRYPLEQSNGFYFPSARLKVTYIHLSPKEFMI